MDGQLIDDARQVDRFRILCSRIGQGFHCSCRDGCLHRCFRAVKQLRCDGLNLPEDEGAEQYPRQSINFGAIEVTTSLPLPTDGKNG